MAPIDRKAVAESATRLLASGRATEAIDWLSAAVEQDADAGRLWELRGRALLDLHDAAGAVRSLEHALCLVPLTAEGQFALASAYELTGECGLAADVFVALADRDTLPIGLLEPLAGALGRVGKPAQALGVCAEAAARLPGEPTPLLGMAFYHRRLGHHPTRVLPALLQALRFEPENDDTRLAVARTLHECGQTGEAAELLSVFPIERSRCPSCLAAMQQIFEGVGDGHSAGRCVDALVALATQDDF